MAVSDIDRTGDAHLAQAAQGAGQSDPFPPEGTDEKIISSVRTGEDALSEADALKATQAALSREADSGETVALGGLIATFISAFLKGFFRVTPHRTQLRHDRKLRDNLCEDQIDSMIDDSFPASDPPSSY